MIKPGKDIKARSKLILVGNANVGKSVIFSHLTGKYVVVSNYPGTTVELSRGIMKFEDSTMEVIDTPGINNLIPTSEDELITLKILLSENDAGVVQVINSLNLHRGLLLTAQLSMLGVPFLMDLNIVDEARSRGIDISAFKLQKITGVPVVHTVATRREGLKKLKSLTAYTCNSRWQMSFSEPIEGAIEEVQSMLPKDLSCSRFLALLFLAYENVEQLLDFCEIKTRRINNDTVKKIIKIRSKLNNLYSGNLAYNINREIHDAAENIYKQVVKLSPPKESKFKDILSNTMLHPVFGIPFVLFVLWITYMFVGKFGAGDVVDFFQGVVFEKWVNPLVISFVELFSKSGFIHELFVGKYGLWTMGMTYAIAIVLPIVGLFFLLFGILEDSGYLPRLAVVLNRPFRMMGLSGKAVLPMILGLGCATMATLTARILSTKKERIIVTLLLALAIPCSAQLGVIMGMLGALPGGALLWWVGSITLVLLLVGKLASMVLPGENAVFIQEISPLRMPQFKNLIIKTLARIQWYLKEAVPLFLLGTLVLFVLDKTGAIDVIEKAAEPVLQGIMGVPRETAAAFIVGFIRRDYAATGLFELSNAGILTPVQTLVSLVAITLFMPCIANLFIIIKERGWKTALWMSLFIVPFAIGFAGVLNLVLKTLGVTFT